MAKTLAQFTVTRTGDDYLLLLEDDDGGTTEFIAGFEELEMIADAIEEQLDSDEEEGLGVDDDADEVAEIEE